MENQDNFNSSENLFKQRDEPPPPKHVKKLSRSNKNVIIAGVCSGIAEYLNIDPAYIRIIGILTLFFNSWSAAAYLIVALFLPVHTSQNDFSELEKEKIRKENFRIILSGVLLFTGFRFSLEAYEIRTAAQFFFLSNNVFVALIVLAYGVYFLYGYRKCEEQKKMFVQFFSRSEKDKILLGVCGGLANYLCIDSSAVRIIFILAAILTLGLFCAAYLILAIAAPSAPAIAQGEKGE